MTYWENVTGFSSWPSINFHIFTERNNARVYNQVPKYELIRVKRKIDTSRYLVILDTKSFKSRKTERNNKPNKLLLHKTKALSLQKLLCKFKEIFLILHCVKSVQVRSYCWFVFSCIRTEPLRIQSEYRKIRTRNNSLFGHFSCSVSFFYKYPVVEYPYCTSILDDNVNRHCWK